MAREAPTAAAGAPEAKRSRAGIAFRRWWERSRERTMSVVSRGHEDEQTGPAVLVADAHDGVLAALCDALEGEGFSCTTARSGEAVAHELGRRRYAAAVLDMRLPGADTLDVLRRARERGVGTPVVLTAVSASGETRREAAALGALGPREKPYALADLLTDVRAAVAAGAPAAPPPG